METWTSYSRPDRQRGWAIGAGVLGAALLLIAIRAHVTPAALLGALLAGLGVAGWLRAAQEVVEVDPASRQVTVTTRQRGRSTRRIIAFDQIERVGIGYLGSAANHVRFHYLVVHLSNGEEYALFAPGRFYEGSSDRSIVAGWRNRLEGYLEVDRATPHRVGVS
jgi:hypothetical protein